MFFVQLDKFLMQAADKMRVNVYFARLFSLHRPARYAFILIICDERERILALKYYYMLSQAVRDAGTQNIDIAYSDEWSWVSMDEWSDFAMLVSVCVIL